MIETKYRIAFSCALVGEGDFASKITDQSGDLTLNIPGSADARLAAGCAIDVISQLADGRAVTNLQIQVSIVHGEENESDLNRDWSKA